MKLLYTLATTATVAAVLLTASFAAPAYANDSTMDVKFAGHRFSPQNLTVPAGQPVTIRVSNDGNRTIEFESFKLNREKVVEPGETILVHLNSLTPGSYDFYDDFNQDVPQGTIVAH